MLERLPADDATPGIGGSGIKDTPVLPRVPPARVRTREILESDIGPVTCLLASGFSRSTRNDWLHIFAGLAEHQAPAGLPKYGYLIESEGAPVGAILVISSVVTNSGVSTIRCNLSSWYVSPAYRSFAHLFISRILKNKAVTYINVSPAPHTLPLITVQGFSRYCDGQFFALSMPFARSRDPQTKVVLVDTLPGSYFETFELDLLQTHAKYGCMSLWCTTPDRAYPFVFRSRVIRGCLPAVQLVFCRDIDEFVRFARPIGRFLVRQGIFCVMIDANGPIPGLVGIYRDGSRPKYYKGPVRPRLGDIAYTESALFGI
jgi:hypothetical protein